MSPDSGEQLTRCPWLELIPDTGKYGCGIYHDRPIDCRQYPVTIEQMVQDECEMLEVRDLISPKQAQNALDRIMADSRPPVGRT